MPEKEINFSNYHIKQSDNKEGYMTELSESARNKIESELKNRHEVQDRYEQLIPIISQYLSKEEQQEFFQDPVSFVSRENYFRGMSPKKIQEAVQGGRMIPEPGDYTGKAVFLTDSPLGAAEFTPNDGSFAVIDPSKLEYMEQSEEGVKVHDIFSDEYKELERKYISSLPEDEQGLAAYTAINRWDTMSKYSQSKPWHTIAMRKDQPVSSVRAFVVFDKITKDVTVLDPSKEEDMEKLWEHFEIERAAV